MAPPNKKLKKTNDLSEVATNSKTQEGHIVSLKNLSITSKSWMIISYVFFKSSLRTFNNKNGKGFRFAFDIEDTSGEIRITAFNETAKNLSSIIELNQWYSISNW